MIATNIISSSGLALESPFRNTSRPVAWGHSCSATETAVYVCLDGALIAELPSTSQLGAGATATIVAFLTSQTSSDPEAGL